MLKVTVKGVVYPFDGERYPMSEAIAIEEKLGMSFHEWRASLGRGSVKALAAFVWLVLKRNGEATTLEDIISGAYELSDSDVDIEQEGGEGPTPPGSPTGAASTSPSSPSDSGSAPGSGTGSPRKRQTS